MCNIAGYIGSRQAMPILIEMMRKEEGWDAAFFTGYSTIYDGKLHTEKVVGPLSFLLAETNAASAPGTIGFIHSRTPGVKGENFQWSHPFNGQGDRHSCVYNGAPGVFKGIGDDLTKELFQKFRMEGHTFRTEMPDITGKSSFGPTRIHRSELRSHYITWLIEQGMDAADALEKMTCDLPAELVTLMLSLDEPDCILYAKTSYPMFLGLADHGTYLATTPQAFPDDVERILYLNNMTAGRVYVDRYTTKPFHNPPASVAAITPSLWKRAYETCVEMIKQQPRKYPDLEKAVRTIFMEDQPGRLSAEAPVVYGILYELEKSGQIVKDIGAVPGQLDGTTTPKFYARWIG